MITVTTEMCVLWYEVKRLYRNRCREVDICFVFRRTRIKISTRRPTILKFFVVLRSLSRRGPNTVSSWTMADFYHFLSTSFFSIHPPIRRSMVWGSESVVQQIIEAKNCVPIFRSPVEVSTTFEQVRSTYSVGISPMMQHNSHTKSVNIFSCGVHCYYDVEQQRKALTCSEYSNGNTKA